MRKIISKADLLLCELFVPESHSQAKPGDNWWLLCDVHRCWGLEAFGISCAPRRLLVSSRDLKSHSSLYPNEAQRFSFISPNTGLMFLQMEQGTCSRVRGKVGLGSWAGRSWSRWKRKNHHSAFPWKKKKGVWKCFTGKDFRDVRGLKSNEPLLEREIIS